MALSPALHPPLASPSHALLLSHAHAFPEPSSITQQHREASQVHRRLQHISGGPWLWGHDGHGFLA